jgi:hypothetical protein
MNDFRFQESDRGTWRAKLVLPSDLPDEHKAEAYRQLKRRAGNELFAILEQNKNPAVIELGEIKERQHNDLFPGTIEISIEVRVTPVRYRNTEIALPSSNHDVDVMRRMNFWQRLKYAVFGR